MKKYLFILAGLLCLIGQGEAEAKAYKLGRSSQNVIGNGPLPCGAGGCNPGPAPCTQPNCAQCKNGENICISCKNNTYLTASGTCAPCPANATCRVPGNIVCNVGYYKDGNQCKTCSSIAVQNGTCTACSADGKCTNAQCNSGYYASNTANGIAMCNQVSFDEMNCVAGYRKVVTGSQACCVAKCSGISCVSGYSPTPAADGCCCMPTGGAIANCQTQNGNTCTKCNSGYYLLGNSCRTCPDNASCSGTANVYCHTGYYRQYFPVNGTGSYYCLACPAHSSCSGDSFTCNNGYYEDLIESDAGNYWGCKSCPTGCTKCDDELSCTQCAKGYSLVNGQCVANLIVSPCPNGQVWHPTLKKCVNAVCWANCQQECNVQLQLGYCSACISGYYLNAQGGCSACSGMISNCTRCASNFDDSGRLTSVVCTKCNGNYHLNSQGQCEYGVPNITPEAGMANYQLEAGL